MEGGSEQDPCLSPRRAAAMESTVLTSVDPQSDSVYVHICVTLCTESLMFLSFAM